MSKILVTGGCGFIGSNFVRYVLGYTSFDVVNVDALTYAGNLANLQDVENDCRYAFEHGDIADQPAMDRVFKQHKPEFVVNFAAESHVDRSIDNVTPFVRSNVCGTQNLLDISKKYGIHRFVQISTDEVYGSLWADDLPFTEDSPVKPNSPYAASKAAADMFVHAYHRTYDMDTVITRCSNNYGPYQHPEKLIPLTILKLSKHQKVPVYGDGRQRRDWLHVQDHCRGVWLALQNGHTGNVYNFGTKYDVRNIDIVNKLISMLVKPRDSVEFVKDRPGHDRRYSMDYVKATEDLGWHPEIKLTVGLESTVRWYLENDKWLEDVVNKTTTRQPVEAA
jgi:dTDP-glucose 4,6-dehydratase